MDDAKTIQVKRYLDWIAPEEGVESLAARPGLTEGIESPPGSTDAEAERAAEALRRMSRGEDVPPDHVDAVEAIILPNERPVVDVVNGSYAGPGAPFEHFGVDPARAAIEKAMPAIGRVELPNHPSLPYGGTGFVVGEGVLMTNRHVAELFSLGIGGEGLSFRPGQTAAVDFLRERDRTDSLLFQITRIVMVHPYWDMALLTVEGLHTVAPLQLSVAPPGDLNGQDVAVVGYPALDPRNAVDLQNRIFGGVFNVKRLQPGKLRTMADIRSFEHVVSAVTHDSSTLGGNSGSAVIDVKTGRVVGLHFAGRYLEANYAVPSHELALDRRVVDAGVNFESEIAGAAPAWSDAWAEADPSSRETQMAPPGEARQRQSVDVASSGSDDGALSWSIPLELTLRLRSPATAQGVSIPDAAVEKLVEPFRDEDFADRHGYDDRFLGVLVPLPTVLDESIVSHLDDGSFVLPYEHFSIVMAKARRLALFTASNVDAEPGRKRPEPGRDYSRGGLTGLGDNDQEKWFTDPRIPAIQQLPDRFFTKDRASFDKGHIVRREDVAWGSTYDEIRRANGDTFHVTNCSPQVANFNRSNKQGAWGRLENVILGQAKTERYSLFAGPVMRPDDPIFLGVDDQGAARVAIPRQFWKVVVARSADTLQTFAFKLEQDLANTDLEFAVDREWLTHMISVPALEQLIGMITFPPELHDSDQFGTPGGESVRAVTGVDPL